MKTTKKTNTAKKLDELISAKELNNLLQLMNTLHGRWCCEGKYEDFQGYIDVFTRALAAHNMQLISFTKRPFMVVFMCPDTVRRFIKITADTYAYGAYAAYLVRKNAQLTEQMSR
jgi:hypothetical protein